MGTHRYRYIAVEGVIGVGKTTLVNRLARAMSARVVLEEFEENPFLPQFYRDRRAYALSTQLFFLMSRFRQQEILAQGDLFQQHTVSDYFFDKDRIFAMLTLEEHELGVYDRLFEVLRPQVPTPDLVIYLKADHDVVMDRIAKRGRDYEKDMDPLYIRQLSIAYSEFFRSFRNAPVLTIDTSRVDLRQDTPHFPALLSMIQRGAPPSTFHGQRSDEPLLPGFE